MIELSGATKRYGGKTALEPTDLLVAPGASLALVGTSGSGKSTVLRLLVGLLAPDAGEVRVLGTDVTPATAPALRRRIGYVLQDGGLFPHLTGRENVALLADHLGWERDRIARRVAELASLVQLDLPLFDRYPTELSGGQRQRVGLVRALMLDPELLLLDEPLGALDPIVRAQLQDDLGRIFGALGKTVILVTHDLAEAAALTSEVALMREGRILQRGPISELLEHPADPFVTKFLGAQKTPWWTS